MSPSEAYSVASQWGSYQRAGDPGACFYSFRRDDGRPVSEAHRRDCLAYTDSLIARMPASDKRQLRRLRRFFFAQPRLAAS